MEMGRNEKVRALQRKIEALEEMIMCCQVHGTIGRCFPVSLNLAVPGVRELLERREIGRGCRSCEEKGEEVSESCNAGQV